MAKPDCDDGWIKKSIELEAALDFADFTKLARTILRIGFSQMYGRGRRPRLMTLSCSEIAAKIGQTRQAVNRGREELIISGAIAPTGDPNVFSFIKDYERWMFVGRLKGGFVPTDKPRLTPAEIADCKACTHYSQAYILPFEVPPSVIQTDDKSGIPVIQTDDTVPESVIYTDDKGQLSVIQADDKTSSKRMTDPETPSSKRMTNPNEASSKRMTERHPNGVQNVIQTDDKSVPPYNPLLGSEIENRENKTEESLVDAKAGEPEPAPESPDASVKRLRSLILKRTRTEARPQGHAESADFASTQFRTWLAEGYPLAIVRESIYEVLATPGELRMTAWSINVARKLSTWKARTQVATPSLATKPTKADRDAAEIARQREIARQNRARKEAIHVQGQ